MILEQHVRDGSIGDEPRSLALNDHDSERPREPALQLPMEIWHLIVDHLDAELGRGPPTSIGITSCLKAIGQTCRALQEVAHPVAYRSLTVTTKVRAVVMLYIWTFYDGAQHLYSSGNLGLPDFARYLCHARSIHTTDDRDIFTRPRIYRLSSQYEADCALIDRRFSQLLWRLADQLAEAHLMWFPRSADASHALRQCGRLEFLSVSDELPPLIRTGDRELHSWPHLKHARFFRCSLATVGHVLSAPRADTVVEHLHLIRVSTGGHDDIFPASAWNTLKTLEILDMGVLDMRDILDSLRRCGSQNALARLAIDCSATDISSLHDMLDSLSTTRLRSLAIMSSPDEESPRARGGHLLFQHIASALPHLEHLSFMRGNGYEVVPWIASLQGYAEALSSLRLRSLTLNHSNGYHSPAGNIAACTFASRIRTMRFVAFRGKVSMSVGTVWRIVRDEGEVTAVEHT